MKRLIPLAWLMVVGILVGACVVASDNPAVVAEESAPVPEAWIGRWEVQNIAGEVPAVATSIEVEANADGTPQLTLHEGDRTLVLSGTLVQIGSRWILSTHTEGAGWSIACLEVNETGTAMTARTLDLAQVKADVSQGVVAGFVDQFGSNDDIVQLTATPSQLRAYLAARPAAFGSLSASLVKLPDEEPSGTP